MAAYLNQRQQFRILYRQFLFRLMDVELLSAAARGDASGLLGQMGALLISMSVLLSWFGMSAGHGIGRQGPAGLWAAERFMVSLTMLVVGIFALLSWDSLFLDRRDVLVLAPLPVRARTLFTAKVAAAASALGLVVAALNSLAAFAWPMSLAPSGTGLLGTLRFVGAFWIALTAAGTFLYCGVIGMQALAAQLPRSWYLRVSSVLQIGAFMLFLGVVCFQPSLNSAAALRGPENQSVLAWLPSYWFMGLLSELSGLFPAESHAAMAPLARRAVLSLPVAILLAGGAFLLSYLRTLRKIVEEPDIAPGARGGLPLPRFGSAPQTALAQFVIRSLVRSRSHRVILGFYLGGGLAIAAVYLGGAQAMLHLSLLEVWRQGNGAPLVVTLVMLGAAALATRTVFSLPLDLRANWIFRLVAVPSAVDRLAAARRAFLTLAVVPVWFASAGLLLYFWPWMAAVEHLLLLGLLGGLLADAFLTGFYKIPFTCSYLPGRSKAHMVFWLGIIPVVVLIHKAVGLEQWAMANPPWYWIMAAVLAAGAIAVRWRAHSTAQLDGAEVRFEETPADELVVLGLDL